MRNKSLYFVLGAFVLGILTYYNHGSPTSDSVKAATDTGELESDSDDESDEQVFGPDVAADDMKVVRRLRVLMYEPSNEPYNLTKDDAKYNPSMGQSKAILSILGEKKNGFFIECGALDGETRSNTLYMEKSLGWDGILIEADPKNFQLLLQKKRKAYSFPVCLSPNPYPVKLVFRQQFNIGKIAIHGKPGKDKVEVECYPLVSILLAVGEVNVDYFSLDVEGAELQVLQAIPWDKVNIRTLSVEFTHGKEGKDSIKNFMESVGYDTVNIVARGDLLANDFIFVKRNQTLTLT